jgi:hypothetical protein
MPIGNWNLQWLNHNSQRSYPITERASKSDSTGTIRLPDSFILALYFPLHISLNVQVDRFYVSTLLISPIGYAISLSYNDPETNTNTLAANAIIAKETHTANATYALYGIDDFADSVGHVVIGVTKEIDDLPPGLYTFSFDDSALEADAIRPMVRSIAALRVVNGVETSELLYGDIEMVAGTNMQIEPGINPESGNPRLIFNAISGLNLNETCSCNTYDEGECIKCINGICSDDGSFSLVGNECVKIEQTPGIKGSLKFSDTCAQPCCGCAELDAIKTQIDRFDDGVNTLQNFVTRLSSEVTQMSLVVLGSRLGDAGCSTCG